MLAAYTRSLHLWVARDLATYRRHGHLPLHPQALAHRGLARSRARGGSRPPGWLLADRPIHGLDAGHRMGGLEPELGGDAGPPAGGQLVVEHESFTKKDWQTNTLTPFLGPCVSGTPIFVGIDQKNYWAQIIGVTLEYKFE